MSQDVQCYAASSYPEKPRSLDWQGEHFVVEEILSQWREPSSIGFKVCCSPGNAVFALIYHFEHDQWEIKPQGLMINRG
jgi:hypothetical protein